MHFHFPDRVPAGPVDVPGPPVWTSMHEALQTATIPMIVPAVAWNNGRVPPHNIAPSASGRCFWRGWGVRGSCFVLQSSSTWVLRTESVCCMGSCKPWPNSEAGIRLNITCTSICDCRSIGLELQCLSMVRPSKLQVSYQDKRVSTLLRVTFYI